MRYFEVAVLILVVIHSAQHMPHEIAKTRSWMQEFIHRMLGDEPYPRGLRLAVAVAMALVTAISISPVIYYGLECGAYLQGAHEQVA